MKKAALALIQTPTPAHFENPSSLMDYVPAIAAGAVMAVVAVPVLMLRKRRYYITFAQTGVGTDFTGTLVVVGGESNDSSGASFWWGSGSRHTFEFESPTVISHGKQYVKQNVWTSRTGLATHRNGTLAVSMPGTVKGNQRTILNIGTRAQFPFLASKARRGSKQKGYICYIRTKSGKGE